MQPDPSPRSQRSRRTGRARAEQLQSGTGSSCRFCRELGCAAVGCSQEGKGPPALPQPLCRAVTPAHNCILVSGMDEAIRAWHRLQKCLGPQTPALLWAPSQTWGCSCETPTFSSSHCCYFLAAKEGILLQVLPTQELMQSIDNQGTLWQCSYTARPHYPLPRAQQEPQLRGLVQQGTKSDPCNSKQG